MFAVNARLVLLAVVGVSYGASALSVFEYPDCVGGPLANNTVCDVTATRATALIAEFTIEEKINHTGNVLPGIPRLGLPPYQFWEELSHGLAFVYPLRDAAPNGLAYVYPIPPFAVPGSNFSYATSFPQPLVIGATFDDVLVKDIADVISTEARAFNNDKRAGLNYFSPNLNLFKDPRWGRGQETPGEDPFRASGYVKALVEGLQGAPGDKYRKVTATCKHYTGYDVESWNGNWRYQFDAQISTQDMSEYYMAPFQTCARDTAVGAFMCSYNAVNGVPVCADPYMLTTVLREHWGWTDDDRYVVSDCDAVQNIYLPHQWASTREQAVADAFNAGLDMDCTTYSTKNLPASISQGLVNITTIDKSLTRIFSSLIRAGYFDPASSQPYRQLGWADVGTPYADALALRAATEGIVLLKNDGGLLPLALDSASVSVAVIGDWANATTQLLGNYAGTPKYLHSPLYAAQQLVGAGNVTYAMGPTGQTNPTTELWDQIWPAAEAADVIVFAGGIDLTVEAEGMDRVTIGWTGAQLDVISSLALYGKPMVVLQMGGGQVDSSPLAANPNISAILWGGYPGQAGGDALFDIITGKVAPAGRLPVTQYPSSYVREVAMTDMGLRPSATNPGRTYKWYNGTAVYEFGHGLHYTSFRADVTSGAPAATHDIAVLMAGCRAAAAATNATATSSSSSNLDQCAFATVDVRITNTGAVTSDYVALGFLAGAFGPAPRPRKSLVAYTRLHDIRGGAAATARLALTLASLARVDEAGNKVLYPGDYALWVDLQPLATVRFALTGEAVVLDAWPQPPTAGRTRAGVAGYEDYFAVYGQDVL